MAHGLHYEVLQSTETVNADRQVYRLKIIVTRATFDVEEPNAVFRYRKEPVQPGSTTNVIMCDGVCSALDVAHIPVFDSTGSADPPYFRLDYVDWIFVSLLQLVEARTLLIAELNTLVEIYDQLETLETVMSGDVGTPAESDSSSSSVSGE